MQPVVECFSKREIGFTWKDSYERLMYSRNCNKAQLSMQRKLQHIKAALHPENGIFSIGKGISNNSLSLWYCKGFWIWVSWLLAGLAEDSVTSETQKQFQSQSLMVSIFEMAFPHRARYFPVQLKPKWADKNDCSSLAPAWTEPDMSDHTCSEVHTQFRFEPDRDVTRSVQCLFVLLLALSHQVQCNVHQALHVKVMVVSITGVYMGKTPLRSNFLWFCIKQTMRLWRFPYEQWTTPPPQTICFLCHDHDAFARLLAFFLRLRWILSCAWVFSKISVILPAEFGCQNLIWSSDSSVSLTSQVFRKNLQCGRERKVVSWGSHRRVRFSFFRTCVFLQLASRQATDPPRVFEPQTVNGQLYSPGNKEKQANAALPIASVFPGNCAVLLHT